MGLQGAEAALKVSGKIGGHTTITQLKLALVSRREVGGMRGVAVKCIDITQNPDCEGSMPASY